jgi:hypothetical protein
MQIHFRFYTPVSSVSFLNIKFIFAILQICNSNWNVIVLFYEINNNTIWNIENAGVRASKPELVGIGASP